jgi:hypothetical protein
LILINPACIATVTMDFARRPAVEPPIAGEQIVLGLTQIKK